MVFHFRTSVFFLAALLMVFPALGGPKKPVCEAPGVYTDREAHIMFNRLKSESRRNQMIQIIDIDIMQPYRGCSDPQSVVLLEERGAPHYDMHVAIQCDRPCEAIRTDKKGNTIFRPAYYCVCYGNP